MSRNNPSTSSLTSSKTTHPPRVSLRGTLQEHKWRKNNLLFYFFTSPQPPHPPALVGKCVCVCVCIGVCVPRPRVRFCKSFSLRLLPQSPLQRGSSLCSVCSVSKRPKRSGIERNHKAEITKQKRDDGGKTTRTWSQFFFS